jgi:uncharacterized protein (TIGR00251 family)
VPPATFLRETSDGTLLSVKLQPRASKNEICSPLGDELKIKVTAPPVDAAANEALVKFLAEKLDCARNKVELLRGQTSRHKTILLHGFKTQEVLQKISRQFLVGLTCRPKSKAAQQRRPATKKFPVTSSRFPAT